MIDAAETKTFPSITLALRTEGTESVGTDCRRVNWASIID